jgi:hypothetical protein
VEVEAQPPVLAAEAHAAQLAAVRVHPITVHAELPRDRGGVRQSILAVGWQLAEQIDDTSGDHLYVLGIERHARVLALPRLEAPQVGRRGAQCAIRARAIGT